MHIVIKLQHLTAIGKLFVTPTELHRIYSWKPLHHSFSIIQ